MGAGVAPLRIRWICGSRIVGGAERATLQVLAGLARRGHRIDARHPPDAMLAAALAAAGIAATPSALGYRSLRQALSSVDVALVTTIGEWAPALLARRHDHARVVLVRHMALPVSPLLRAVAARRADAVIAVSGAVRERLHGRVGLAPADVTVIHNPVRLPIRERVPDGEMRAAARRRLALASDGPCVAFLGGFTAAKGLIDALGAVRAATRALGPTAVLVCGPAGTGDERAAAERAARALGIDARCHWLGMVDDVAEVLTAADALLVATHSRLSEALPLTVLEAMACGTPVVAYAVGGIAEALGGDAAGFLVAPDHPAALAAAVTAALTDPADATRRATAALARARTAFDPESIVAQYEALLQRVCGARS